MKNKFLAAALCALFSSSQSLGTTKKTKSLPRQDRFLHNAHWSLQATLTQRIAGSGEGDAVALSADGTTLAVGADHFNDFSGATEIYTTSGITWHHEATLTQDIIRSQEGTAVTLSADGTIVAVGAPNFNNTGAAHIYMKSNSLWLHQATLTQNALDSHEGISVALSADGNTLAVGADGFGGESTAGATQIYSKSDNAWKHQATLTQNIELSNEGSSVALSANGATVAVGASGYYKVGGATQIYTRSDNAWKHQVTLTQDGGSSVALSTDGIILAVGSDRFNNSAGAIEIYTRSGATWKHQATLTQGIENSGEGSSVALSANGTVLAAGGAEGYYTKVATTQIYVRSGTAWKHQATLTQNVTETSPNANAEAVALSANGTVLVVGASHFNNGTGATQIYLSNT